MERTPEFPVDGQFLRIRWPSRRSLLPFSLGVKELFGDVIGRCRVDMRRLPGLLAKQIDYFPAENTGQPGSQSGCPLEFVVGLDRRGQRFLHQVFCRFCIAHAQHGKAVEIIAMFVQPLLWI